MFSFASFGKTLEGAYAQDAASSDPAFLAAGSVASLHNYEDGVSSWIVSGGWKLQAHVGEDNEEPSASFIALLRMVQVDGAAMHRHKISDFELTRWSLENTTKTLEGTVTVTLRDGPLENVPVAITASGGSVSIQLDPQIVDHFGPTPIYGMVLRATDNTEGRSVQGQTGGDSAVPDSGPANNNTAIELEGLERSIANYHGNASGYLVYPQNATDLPAVIMIHEWWGVNQNIKNMAEELAKEGHVVLAADLYGKVATEPARARELSTTVRSNPDAAIENLQEAASYVSSLPNVNSSRIASLGWCFGGGWSLQLALNAEQPLAATVIYYGSLVTDGQELAEIQWPVMGVFGTEDQAVPVESARQFDAALDANNITNEIYIYEGVGHAFANPSGGNYAPEETEDAWNKTLAFLSKYV